MLTTTVWSFSNGSDVWCLPSKASNRIGWDGDRGSFWSLASFDVGVLQVGALQRRSSKFANRLGLNTHTNEHNMSLTGAIFHDNLFPYGTCLTRSKADTDGGLFEWSKGKGIVVNFKSSLRDLGKIDLRMENRNQLHAC